MANEAVAFMEKHQHKPFFVNYWMFSVHAPFDAKKDRIEKACTRLNPEEPQRSPTYAAMIESMDDAVGTLLDTLDRLGLADNTIIVFTSDNGGNMNDSIDGTTPKNNAPLRGGKATMFDGGTRVPAIIVMPGVTQAGTRNNTLIQSEDYYPTLLERLAIAPAPSLEFDGVSLLPALQNRELTRKAIFQFFPHAPEVPDWLPPSVSIHRDHWKLFRIFHGGENGAHRHLLYNLQDDIGKKNNLEADHPELVKELDALIENYLVSTHAVVPVANPKFDPTRHRPELEGVVSKKPKS
jgi:arylsulfatase A-like enzyme